MDLICSCPLGIYDAAIWFQRTPILSASPNLSNGIETIGHPRQKEQKNWLKTNEHRSSTHQRMREIQDDNICVGGQWLATFHKLGSSYHCTFYNWYFVSLTRTVPQNGRRFLGDFWLTSKPSMPNLPRKHKKKQPGRHQLSGGGG